MVNKTSYDILEKSDYVPIQDRVDDIQQKK